MKTDTFKKSTQNILLEIEKVLSRTEEKEVLNLVKELVKSKKIVATGAGRVGMAVRGFAMRLGHLGLKAYTVGDSTVPAVGRGDLLLVSSGSGETQTIFDLAVIAKKNGARIALITGNKESRIATLADVIVEVQAPSKTKPIATLTSSQPMTTLNEQCLHIFFDAVVLLLMHHLDETHETMWKRHSNLE